MINLVMTKKSFKVKSLRIEENKDTPTEYFLLADTWDKYSTRICTGSFDLCKIVKESIDQSIIEGKSGHLLDIRAAYTQLRQRDIKGYQPMPADQIEILNQAVPTAVEEEPSEENTEQGIYSKADYERIEEMFLDMVSARPSARNMWTMISVKSLARTLDLNTDESACLEKAMKAYAIKHGMNTKKVGLVWMYELPFKKSAYGYLINH